MQTVRSHFFAILSKFFISSLVFLYVSSIFACPVAPPKGFQEFKNENGFKLFSDPKKTAVIGFKCQSMEKQEAYKSLQYFSDRTVLDETTSYYSLSAQAPSISRIYFKVKNQELVQVSMTTSTLNESDVQKLHKTVVDFLNSP